jgi:hypothetical protein
MIKEPKYPACTQVVGGVTERGAWVESEHDFGALFCGQEVFAGGAVGCIMRGPLSMQQVRHTAAVACKPFNSSD